MQSLVPDLATPLDEIAAYTLWFRLSSETLADILPYCVNARQQGKYRTYTVPHQKLAGLIIEEATLRQEVGKHSFILHALTAPAACYADPENLLAYGENNFNVELVFEFAKKNPDGLLLITGGNKSLIGNDPRVSESH